MSGSKTSILVVDDNQDMFSVVSDALESFDYELRFATNAEEARKIIKAEDFSLIICDIKMPGQDGLSFHEQLRGEANKTPFLFISGEVSDANSMRI
jgi:CheY-like chemotaxis protein